MPEILARANFYLFEGEGANPQMRSGGGPSGAPADKGRATALHIQYDILILMNTMERITITLTPEMAQAVRGAVEAGEYASTSEIIREALRDWRHKRALQEQEFADLRAKIQEGLDDIAAGRVHDFDHERIIRKGEERLKGRDASA